MEIPSNAVNIQGHTILIIDDNPANLSVMVDYLAGHGFQIIVARDGKTGIRLAQQDHPDLILLDILLPDIDGFEACRRLKRDELTQAIPVIFMTIVTRTADKVRGFEAGGVDYITKPFHHEEVFARVTAHLRIRYLTQKLEEANERLELRVAERTKELAQTNARLKEEIAERKRAEETLQRLNRELRAISDCNQMLIRATDERTLLHEICRIICDEAGYRLAWVGYVEHDEAKSVRPVAWRGYDGEYVTHVNISWDENVGRGQGPGGVAIRTGRSTYIEDFSTDPHVALWREAALQRGYRSLISLPLRDEERTTFGILNIYSTELKAFTPGEVRLLEELAGDMALGIGMLRSRVQRKQVEVALRESEQRYRLVFENSPISIGEEDFSDVKRLFDDLKNAGITDIETYFSQHPETIQQWVKRIRLLDVNQAALELHTATNKDELLAGLVNTFTPETYEVFREAFICLWHGEIEMVQDTVIKTLTGDLRNVTVYLSVCPGYEHTLSKILVSLTDITERKQAEDALRESEWRYREIFDNVLDSLYLLEVTEDGHFRNLEINPAFEKSTGLPRTQLIGKLIEETVPEETASIVNAKYRRCVEAGYPIEEEVELDLPGGRHYFHSTLIPARDETGRVHRIIGISRDITKRKRAEEALRASENRFRVLSENAFVGIYIIQDGRLSYVNSTLAKIFGYTPEELTGADPALVIHPDDQAMVSENLRRLIVGEVDTVHYEFRGRCKDGETKNIEVLGGRSDFGGKTAVIGNLMDVTDRKRAEDEIARSLAAEKKARKVAEILHEANESFSRTLNLDDVLQNLLHYLRHLVPYDSANVMLLESDFQLRVAAINGYESWSNADLTRQISFDLRTTPVLNELVTTQKSVLVTDTRAYDGWVRPAGAEHVISWIGVPIIAGKQVIGVYSIDKAEPGFFTEDHRHLVEGLAGQAAVAIQNARLHTQIKRTNIELEQRVFERTALLEAANKELEAFSYSVSHDLRSPLRHIGGFLELLRTRLITTLDEESLHYMDIIADSTRRMGMLIDDLLSFSRMNRSEMSKVQFDLADLVQDVIQEFEPETETRDILWQISPLPEITGDRAMLRMVLENLISNALKFTRSRTPAKIEIGWRPGSDTEIVAFIRDNGVGFDMQYADKLFGVFQRLHRVDEFEGTGIGLANVRRIIERHGGKTWAEAQPDRGATFYFSLPRLEYEIDGTTR